MSEDRKANSKGKQVAVVVGATSKWQSNGRNTLLAHGQTVDDSSLTGRRSLGRRGRHRAEVRPGGLFRCTDHPQ